MNAMRKFPGSEHPHCCGFVPDRGDKRCPPESLNLSPWTKITS